MIARRVLGAGLSAALLLMLAACGERQSLNSAQPDVLNFSILATENSTSLDTLWRPVLADMEEEIGIPVKPFYGSNYTALIEALRFGQTDVGWFSNLSGLEAVRRADAEIFARTFDPSGEDGYRSVLIATASSGLTLEDVLKCDRTLDFGIGDAKSTSGTLAPMTYLFGPRAIEPERCFKQVRTANHQANLFAVANGVLDVATNNSTAIRLQGERDVINRANGQPTVTDKINVIWESPKLPEDPIVWRKNLDPAVKEKVRQFFLTYGKGEGPEAERQRALLAAISIGGFLPADASHLLPVREMEATEALITARNSRDPARIAQAQAALDVVTAEREALDARAGEAPIISAPMAPVPTP
ncbi:MAG: phosphate/phosphite/phosphonate ABC transporter substrate-binding protein [Phenylobacterium sp.]|uniref:phosphate/phosphite/phosphonate ABC transporter substrate-binding protein n=1 Tax=Phenylobacterium sp. TaxID=1871053 RepID=UPI00271AA6E5|nr:phosphate/phosphite/phosphonate ABC transporter substrate-binding protein [Phenylobacterium sp.]MDO8902602.1 phosphate/phosphite/phosphonate ABC transporter substrate-binding protein [Phenylobacterium sp.]